MQGRGVAATPEGRKDSSLAGEMGKFSSSPRIIIEMAGKFCWEIIKN